jgi:hypothetical protein
VRRNGNLRSWRVVMLYDVIVPDNLKTVVANIGKIIVVAITNLKTTSLTSSGMLNSK